MKSEKTSSFQAVKTTNNIQAVLAQLKNTKR